MQVLHTIPPRLVHLRHDASRRKVLYTDAATIGDAGLRIGIWLMSKGNPTICSSYDVPAEVVARWRLRTTYIGQGELLAVPVALSTMADHLRGTLLTWYIDNVSAASAAIKGASPDADNSPMALVGALLAAALDARVWIEYVASEQNRPT